MKRLRECRKTRRCLKLKPGTLQSLEVRDKGSWQGTGHSPVVIRKTWRELPFWMASALRYSILSGQGRQGKKTGRGCTF